MAEVYAYICKFTIITTNINCDPENITENEKYQEAVYNIIGVIWQFSFFCNHT